MSARRVLQRVHHWVELEERVGQLWHRWVSAWANNWANQTHVEAEVALKALQQRLGVFYRALGQARALKIAASSAVYYGMQPGWLQRLAGQANKVELAWYQPGELYLPARFNRFSDKALNQAAYFWLSSLATLFDELEISAGENVLQANRRATEILLARYPGMAQRYQQLMRAQLALRPAMDQLAQTLQHTEQQIQQCITDPTQEMAMLPDNASLQKLPPVFIWLYMKKPQGQASASPQDESPTTQDQQQGEVVQPEEQRQYQAQQVEMPDGDKGLVLDRFENIFSWAEYVKVDRSTDEDEELASAEAAAQDLDYLSVARDEKATAKRIRFDLDLPSSEEDDQAMGEGIHLPEWDYRKQELRQDYCCLQTLCALDAAAIPLPNRLAPLAKRIRNQFSAIVPQRIWHRGQPQGSEVDLSAYVDFKAASMQGQARDDQGLFSEFKGAIRDLDCLLLADLSLSTDASLNNNSKVIDIIRDSLMLFAEALNATGDGFALYGFSSRYRQHVRFHEIKTFAQVYDARVRGRIQVIKPGFYTRMGAAIRQASAVLEKRQARQRILIILTDGKPNDLDLYEGRYGVEDTRMAIIEARQKGLLPFCVSIDPQANEYLPYMFGIKSYVKVKKAQDLPEELPMLYARLTMD